MSILERLKTYAEVLENEAMSKHTTYKIGGTVKYYIYPKNCTCLMCVLEILDQESLPYYIIGRGSNVLCSDDHFEGAIINLDRYLNDFYFEPSGVLVAQAGCSIINMSVEAMKKSLTGLEFANGIPGSIGGGLYMNAGAYKDNLANHLIDVCVLKDKTICWMKKDELEYAYRHSIFQKHKDWTILVGRFQLEKGNQDEIRDLMDSRRQRRMDSQPLDKPSAGSTFRNPDEIPAWKLIEELGLRGYRVGGASVSEKHCNFIVNEDMRASAKDVLDLIEHIKALAKEKYNIDMVTEVERLYW